MIATRAAALALLGQRGPGYAAIFVPDYRRGHYAILRRGDLAALPLYELIGLS